MRGRIAVVTRVLLDIPHRVAGHCGSGAFRDLLAWARLGYGAEPSEALVFGLAGGLAFGYLRAAALTPPVYLIGRDGVMEESFCRRLGVALDLRRTDDPPAAAGWVHDELDAGHPVMVWADIGELPYLRVKLRNTHHDLVVVGYDDDLGEVYVADNDRAELQTVPADAFARARSSPAFPGPTRNATFVLRFPERLPPLHDAARDACAAAARNLRSGGDGIVDMTADGVEGVQRFVDDVGSWPDLFDREELAAALWAVGILVEKAGTGGGLFRRLQADFLAEVHAATGDQAFAAAATAYDAAARAWSAAATGDAPAPSWAALRAALAPLPELERRGLEALEAIARG
jgi:hypothetical protein